MRAQMGDLIRDRKSGRLHRVRMVRGDGYWTERVYDGAGVLVPIDDAERIINPSLFPGDPEITDNGRAA